MLEWLSDRVWDLGEFFVSATKGCRKISIGILVYRLRRSKR